MVPTLIFCCKFLQINIISIDNKSCIKSVQLSIKSCIKSVKLSIKSCIKSIKLKIWTLADYNLLQK